MKIRIKNMDCNKCIMVVSHIFHKAGIQDALTLLISPISLSRKLVPLLISGKLAK